MSVFAEIPAFFTVVFPWTFMGVGALFANKAVFEMMRAGRSHRWPTVQGQVVLAKVEVTDTGGDYPHDLFAPVIEYSYTVDGVSRKSRKLGLVEINLGSRARAEAILKRYKAGAVVRVYVSPHDPDTAILDPGVRWPSVGKLVFGLLFLGIGVALLLMFGGLPSVTRGI